MGRNCLGFLLEENHGGGAEGGIGEGEDGAGVAEPTGEGAAEQAREGTADGLEGAQAAECRLGVAAAPGDVGDEDGGAGEGEQEAWVARVVDKEPDRPLRRPPKPTMVV